MLYVFSIKLHIRRIICTVMETICIINFVVVIGVKFQVVNTALKLISN